MPQLPPLDVLMDPGSALNAPLPPMKTRAPGPSSGSTPLAALSSVWER